MLRVFVAVGVPPDAAGALAEFLPVSFGSIRPVGPELMHITLAFIGPIAREHIPDVVLAATTAAMP